MATKKYQIFVSSTFRDLFDERQDTIRNILDLKHIPAGMELFPAADVEQLTYIKKVIDECDYYLLIVGGRYGSFDQEGISFTEREYDYAVETGKFVIAFVHGEPGAIPLDKSDVKPEVADALQAFRSKVTSGRLVRSWSNRQDLQLAVIKSLMHAFSDYPQVGWIRGDAAASDRVLEQSNRALQENADLRAEIAQMRANSAPRFDNLADLNDSVQIRFRTQYTPRQGKPVYTHHTAQLRLLDIFIRFGAELSTAKTDLTIAICMKELIKKDTSKTPYDIEAIDKAMVKAQLIALGLIKGEIGMSVKNTVHEYLSLTEKGLMTYMEAIVARKTASA